MKVRNVAFVAMLVLAACGSQAAPSAPAASSVASNAASARPAGSAAVSGSASAKPAGSASASPEVSLQAAPGAILASYPALVTDTLPTWLAGDQGIFKKNGLNVDHRYLESSTGLAALLSGQTQIYEGGSETLSAEAQGADLVVFAILSPVYPWTLEAVPAVKTAADLKGKKVGVSRFGSASDVGTRLALQKLGLDPSKDVEIVQVGSESARISALESNAIQAGVGQPPANFELEAKGLHPLLDMAQAKIPGALGVIATKRSYATANHDVIQRFVDSVVQAIALEKRDEGTATKVLSKYLKLDDQNLLDKAWTYYTKEVLPDYPYPTTEWVPDNVTVLEKQNPNVANTDFNKMFDRSFVQDAQNRGLASKSG